MRNGPYELVIAPDKYPGPRYRGRYCYEHHLVYWQNTGILPQKGECIHHINERRRDNRMENLELVSVGDHNRKHNSTGRTTTKLTCSYCGRTFGRETRLINKDYKNHYCNRTCMGSAQGKINGKKRWSNINPG